MIRPLYRNLNTYNHNKEKPLAFDDFKLEIVT